MVKKVKVNQINEKVNSFKTKHKEGFLHSEIEEILKDYPKINLDKFYDALRGNTCLMKEGKIVNYHCDIEKALRCGIENRDLTIGEWD